MTRVWRLCQVAQQTNAFSGEGAARYGGRWNSLGMPAMYAAGSLSLAVLEVLVHVDTDLLSNDFVAFAVDIPEELPSESIILDELPKNWRDEYPPEYCCQLGNQWLQAGTTAILWVPSAIVPNETIALLNPRHQDFGQLVIHPAESFQFDHRPRRH